MNDNLQKFIIDKYSFSEIKNLQQVSLGGLMNDNYTFDYLGKKYFVKVYKFYPKSKVEMSHNLIKYLVLHGIKTYTLIENRDSQTFSEENNITFEISEFIIDAKNRIEEVVSEKIVEQMAHKLAKYHHVVANIDIGLDFIDVFSPDQAKVNFLEIENILKTKTSLNNFDKFCLEMVRIKIEYIKKIPEILKGINLDNFAILINHGDFLTGNCLFDSDDNIKYVIDFEHIIKTYRIWDVVKSSAFLARKNKHEIFHSEINIDVLIDFLKIYHSQNPFRIEEVTALPELFVVASILSDFVLYGYYLANNQKAKEISSLSKGEWLWWIENKDNVRMRLNDILITIKNNGKN